MKNKFRRPTLIIFLALLLVLSMMSCTIQSPYANDNETTNGTNQSSQEQSSQEQSSQDQSSQDQSNTPDPGSQNDNSMPAQEALDLFSKYLNDGSYEKAADIHNNNIKGNAVTEQDAKEIFNQFLSDTVNKAYSGEYDEATANTRLSIAENVVKLTSISDSQYKSSKTDVETALKSKTAYQTAVNYENSKDYLSAISSYKKVAEKDSNYATAQAAIDRCYNSFKESYLAEAAQYAANNEYSEAISTIEKLLAKLPGDSEALSKRDQYKSDHINYFIKSANDAFVNSATDYEQATKIINSGLQYYPDSKELADKKEYYALFVPVNLYDLETIKSSKAPERKSYAKDTYKTEFEKCFVSRSYDGNYDITFDIEKKYNTFTFTVFGLSDNAAPINSKIIIYGDDIIIYEQSDIPDNKRSFDVSIDVTGISDLKIEYKAQQRRWDINTAWTYPELGISNMFLQRTLK